MRWVVLVRAVTRTALTIGVLGWLDGEVGLTLVEARLPLPALLLQGGLGAVLGVDVGQVRWGVVVGLHALIVLNLWERRETRNREDGGNREVEQDRRKNV